MKTLKVLIKRNCKLFFKDKGMLIPSLITPIILLVLYVTFLGKVYKDTFLNAIPEGINISVSIIDGLVSGQLFSSLLAVSCVTVSFCANLVMVQDKVTKARSDIDVSPVNPSIISLAYYISTAINALIISIIAFLSSLIYVAFTGWYLSFSDCLLILLDIILLVMFGTVLSSLICLPLKTNGQMSAVGTIISSGYGFICGAYMPISQFSVGLQKTLMFLPGTYGTSLIRNHSLRGAFLEMKNNHFPNEVIEMMKDSIDCNIYFFDNKISILAMYIIMVLTIFLLLGVYILLTYFRFKKNK